jgi:aspartate kinase
MSLSLSFISQTARGNSLDIVRCLHQETLRGLNLLDSQQQVNKGGKALSSSRLKPLSTVQQDVDALWRECQQLLTGVQLLQELSPRSKDQLVSYGERCAVRILAAQLNQIGVPAQAYDAWEVGVLTAPTTPGTRNHCDGRLVPDYVNRIRTAFEGRVVDPNVVAVVTGFIAKEDVADDTDRCEEDSTRRRAHWGSKITTLGRGGSDLTATAIGSALGVDEIQVWKDVDGILTADPRVVPNAVPLTEITFEEASELSHFGAQVLHPIAMEPCREHHIPVRVKNSYNPGAVGTLIHDKRRDSIHDIQGMNSNNTALVTAITCKRDVRLLDIHSTQMMGTYGFLSKVFGEFEKHQVSVDVLASSEVSVSLTLDKNQQDEASMERLIHDLDHDPAMEVTVKNGMSILTLIADVEKSSDVLATVFEVFSQQDIGVQMMSQGASKVNISLVISNVDLERAIRHLHDCFFGGQCVVEAGLQGPQLEVNEEAEEHDVLDLLQEIQGAVKLVEMPSSISTDVVSSGPV